MRYELPTLHGMSLLAEDAEGYEVKSEDVADEESADAGKDERRALEGRALRNAMALVTGAQAAFDDRNASVQSLRETMRVAAGATPAPEDPAALIAHLRRLALVSDRGLAEQLRLLHRFDEMQLWKQEGCRDCAMWMDRHLGISRVLALERMRVARALVDLPLLESLFAVGKLSWSKVREMTRVVTPECEHELCATVLDLSVTETIAICQRWRWPDDADGQGSDPVDPVDPSDPAAVAAAVAAAEGAETAAAQRAWSSRALHARMKNETTMRITLDLPAELGAEFMKSLDCQEDILMEKSHSVTEANVVHDKAASGTSAVPAAARRADAAVQLSRKAIAFEGEACSASDRYRVLLTLDARVLVDEHPAPGGEHAGPAAERPAVIGWGPLAIATARRLADISALSVTALDEQGEVVGTGRSTRLCSARMLRAVQARDRCCCMPGCSNTRWTHAHHVTPWALGGKTETGNLALLCSSCHRKVHEEGLTLERATADEIELDDADGRVQLEGDEEQRARARVVKVCGYRVLDRNGHVVAGPARAVPAAAPNIRRCGGRPAIHLDDHRVGPDERSAAWK